MKNHEKPKITQINPLINHDKPMEFLGVFFSQKNRTQCLEVKSMVTVRRDRGVRMFEMDLRSKHMGYNVGL